MLQHCLFPYKSQQKTCQGVSASFISNEEKMYVINMNTGTIVWETCQHQGTFVDISTVKMPDIRVLHNSALPVSINAIMR